MIALLGLAVLWLELLNLDLDFLVDTRSELWSVSKLEEYLKPHKHRGKEDGLDEVVEQSRGTPFIFTMTNKLEDPADNMDSQSTLESCVRVLLMEVVAKCCTSHAEKSQKEARKGL